MRRRPRPREGCVRGDRRTHAAATWNRARRGSGQSAPAPTPCAPRACPRPTAYETASHRCSAAGGRHHAELLEKAQVVETAPTLPNPTIVKTEDVDALERHLPTCRSDPHDLAAVRASGREVLGDKIRLGDQQMK